MFYRWMLRPCSQFTALFALAVALAGCSKDQGASLSADSQLSIFPPGLERLSRVIDSATLEARIVVTAAEHTQSFVATPTVSPEGSWTASFQVPQGVPFSIEIVWSAPGPEDSNRVDYALFRESYTGIAQNTSINVNSDQYDVSATAFDSDGDGISNFDELVDGTLAADEEPLADSAVVYYSLDNGRAFDSSGNRRHGQVIAPPGVSTPDESGAADSAIRLESIQFIRVPAGAVEGLQDFTIMFKVKFDNFNEGEFQYNTIFSIASRQNHAIALAYGHNETAFPITQRFYLASDGGGNIPDNILFERMNTITLNSWHCVAVYRNGAAVGLVVDGVLIGGGEVGFTNAAIRADEGGFVIGQQQSGDIDAFFDPGMGMAGVIDEFYVFDRALELQDIQNTCD